MNLVSSEFDITFVGRRPTVDWKSISIKEGSSAHAVLLPLPEGGPFAGKPTQKVPINIIIIMLTNLIISEGYTYGPF